jgi:hypothetical protein
MKARSIPESDQLAAIPTPMDGIVARISALPDMRTATVRSVRCELTTGLKNPRKANVPEK